MTILTIISIVIPATIPFLWWAYHTIKLFWVKGLADHPDIDHIKSGFWTLEIKKRKPPD